ncbi:MG032/MG096/MG288 family 2 [Mycoplasmoides pneumoniae]|nr:MG032/MG096/MG288 family 2 [Mycoplasmoides pneumoniae]
MKSSKNFHFKTQAFLLSLFSATLTFSVFLVPTLSQNGSANDPHAVNLNSSSFDKRHNKSYLLQRNSSFSQTEFETITSRTDWEQNFSEFQNKFADQLIDPQAFTLIDVYNLFSGFQQKAQALVNLANNLQKRADTANEIFPVEDKNTIPKVPEGFFSFFGEDYFPRLTPRGLNISDTVASLFNDYNLNSIKLKAFNLQLLKQNDIVLKNKVRYSFAIEMKFHTVYVGKNTKIDLDFALQAQTNNFSSLEELRESFTNSGQTLSTQLFWKPVIDKLITDEGNDLTTIARTAIGENLFDLKVNLTDSVIDGTVLTKARKSFEERILNPFIEQRKEAKRIHDEEQARLERERKQLEEELKGKEKKVQELIREKTRFLSSFNNVKSFKDYWKGKGKNVEIKSQLIEVLKLAFKTDRNRTFIFLTDAFRNAVDWYYNAKKDDQDSKKKAFGDVGIELPKLGVDGIFIPNWLRWELKHRANLKLNLQSVTTKDIHNDINGWGVPKQIFWNEAKNGIEFRQTYPFKYAFQIRMKYTGDYGLKGIYWTLANWGLGGIPPEWKGEMELVLNVDGQLADWITSKNDYPGTLFQFRDDKLLFTLHITQWINVQDQRFKGLLKKQQLDVLEPWGGDIKVPVVDLASYLHFLILADKS